MKDQASRTPDSNLQRQLNRQEEDFVLEHGHCIEKQGIEYIILDEDDLLGETRRQKLGRRLIGAVVAITAGGETRWSRKDGGQLRNARRRCTKANRRQKTDQWNFPDMLAVA